MLQYRSEKLLSPLSVLFVTRESVEVEEGLGRLWPQEGVLPSPRHFFEVKRVCAANVEELRRKACFGGGPHLHARLGQPLCHRPKRGIAALLQQILIRHLLQPEGDHSGCVATEVIHLPDCLTSGGHLDEPVERTLAFRRRTCRSWAQQTRELIHHIQPQVLEMLICGVLQPLLEEVLVVRVCERAEGKFRCQDPHLRVVRRRQVHRHQASHSSRLDGLEGLIASLLVA
mmetsp:Transcript_19817/g.50635  ORF Transcript_19817/g.50635 Transcript_19817/m.50635 type:complete len:229 (-) Transcript_19817:170-856(-)